MTCAVGPANVRSNSLGPNGLTVEGGFNPGKQDDRQSFNLSLNPMRETQFGNVSNRLRKEATRVRTFLGSNIPRGAPPMHTRYSTFSAQKQRITYVATGVCCMANE